MKKIMEIYFSLFTYGHLWIGVIFFEAAFGYKNIAFLSALTCAL